jgi:glycosyl transferase family 25
MKVYALCLEGYAERQVFQELQAKKYGLDLEIVSAVDGSLLSVEQLQYAANHWSSPITAKDLGCFLSHKKAWELVRKRQETAIIIEDDIVFSPIITNAVNEISRKSDNHAVIYDLEYVPRNHLLAKKPKWFTKDSQITATKIFQNKNGAGCYCLNSIAAERLLLDTEKEAFKLTDSFIWNRVWAEFLQIEPAPAIQMIYLPKYDAADKNNRQTRRATYMNNSLANTKLISLKKFYTGAMQSISGHLFGVSREIIYKVKDFGNIRR